MIHARDGARTVGRCLAPLRLLLLVGLRELAGHGRKIEPVAGLAGVARRGACELVEQQLDALEAVAAVAEAGVGQEARPWPC